MRLWSSTDSLGPNNHLQMPSVITPTLRLAVVAANLPGGFLYVNSGLITTADEESEFAGVLAHEITQVAARHGTEQQAKAWIADFSTSGDP